MTWKNRFALTLIISAFVAAPTFAQDTATPVPTSPVENTVEVPAAATDAITPSEIVLTEDETETTVGALTLVHPKAWFASAGQEGKTLLTNIDLMTMPPNSELPPETVLAQIEVFSISQLPPEIGSVERPTQILEALPSQEGQPAAVISEVDVDGVLLGRANFSSDTTENIIYIRLLDADTFLLAVLASLTPGDAVKNEATFQRAFATARIEADAPFTQDAARYDGIEQSVSPEGFPQLGNPDAPVKIIEIGSFDCSACRSFHDLAMPVILERIQAGQVQFTYIPVFGTGSLPLGQRAAVAALCAAEQGQFWPYHDGLYGWQDFGSLAFLDARLQNGATGLGLDVAAFDECLTAQTPVPVLQSAVDLVKTLPEFNGTPTVLLNGVSVNWSRLPTLIDEAMLAAEMATPETAPEMTAEATTQP